MLPSKCRVLIIFIFIFTYGGRASKEELYNKAFMYVLYDIMYPKISSKTCQTGSFAHDCHKLKIEHDIIDKPVKPVYNLLVRLT